MSKVYVLSEGQTEQAFIRQILAPELSTQGIYLHEVLVGKPGHKGGIRSFDSVQGDITRLLRQETEVKVTTLFDRYALPADWPGLSESMQQADLSRAHLVLCNAMHSTLCGRMGRNFRPERFIPYIQFYELEALLFVDPRATARLLEDSSQEGKLLEALREKGGCEQINDGTDTAPSKRITRWFPNYKKGKSINAHLPRICSQVGLPAIRHACPLFNRWVDTLASLRS